MADYDLLMQLKASREAKVRSVAGDTSRFEWDREKAQRLGHARFYSNPTPKPPDLTAPQKLGDPLNLRTPSREYFDDTPDNEWMRSPNESAERKPGGSEGQNPGRGFVGSERQAAHRVGRPHDYDITKNPAEAGYGARDRTSNPATQSKMGREGKKPRDGDGY
jgi:hypothetical protein